MERANDMVQKQHAACLSAAHLEQLCNPTQIESTMHLLFALNHWAKARDRLFFADRQGLYEVKTVILRQAYEAGQIVAYAYIDGSAGFGAELAFDTAADITAETIIWRLEELSAYPNPGACDPYDEMARRFYTRMTGKTKITAADVAALEARLVAGYIREELQKLEQEARATRQPIPRDKLVELCIAPGDLLYIQDHRYYEFGNWDSWDRLDGSDLRKLDPEGLSLVAFHYISSSTHYVFHQPLRLAEAFLPAWTMAQLKLAPWTSRESGEYYGRTITETESLRQPIADILRQLGVDIMAICPRQLSDKQEYTLAQALHYAAWSEAQDTDEDEEELDEEFWQTIGTPTERSRPVQVQRKPAECPLCYTLITAPGIARIEHWQQNHADQHLTISQARWVLNHASITTKEQFCLECPPDYRAPDKQGQGTRYWKIATLERWMRMNTIEGEV